MKIRVFITAYLAKMFARKMRSAVCKGNEIRTTGIQPFILAVGKNQWEKIAQKLVQNSDLWGWAKVSSRSSLRKKT